MHSTIADKCMGSYSGTLQTTSACQYFTVGQPISVSKVPFSGVGLNLIDGSLGPDESRSVQPYFITHSYTQHTDAYTDIHNIRDNRPHLCKACRRCGLVIRRSWVEVVGIVWWYRFNAWLTVADGSRSNGREISRPQKRPYRVSHVRRRSALLRVMSTLTLNRVLSRRLPETVNLTPTSTRRTIIRRLKLLRTLNYRTTTQLLTQWRRLVICTPKCKVISLYWKIRSVKLEFHGTGFPRSILVTSSRGVVNKSRGNRACRTCRTRILVRMSRGCYAENGPVEFKL